MVTHYLYFFKRLLDEGILNIGYLCLIELLFVGTVIAVHFYYHWDVAQCTFTRKKTTSIDNVTMFDYCIV